MNDMDEEMVNDFTKKFGELCVGQQAHIVVAASMNMIQSCITYGPPNFQRVTAEMLIDMGNTMLRGIGAKAH